MDEKKADGLVDVDKMADGEGDIAAETADEIMLEAEIPKLDIFFFFVGLVYDGFSFLTAFIYG